MMVTIIVTISAFIIYLISIHYLKNWIHDKVVDTNNIKDHEDFYKKHPSARQYAENEHNWNPSFNLEHRGLQVFNIPFVPEDNEIFDAIYVMKPQFIDNQMCLLQFFMLGDKRGTKISAQYAKKTLIQFHF